MASPRSVAAPVLPPVEPMLAKVAEGIPVGEFLYEPKWDGFRALVFRGKDVFIQSRDSRPFDRYFPDLHEVFLRQLPEGCVVDGEIVIATASGLDFDALQMRLHPAASRVDKHARTADCVVAGFRWHKAGAGIVGSLLLGLYDDNGVLQHVGVTSSFDMATRRKLADELQPLRDNALQGHPWAAWADAAGDGPQQRMPGARSRWSGSKDLSWVPVRPERVCEVRYDHLQGDRFRHATLFLRWRPDKRPEDCRYDQLETTKPYELEKVFATKSDEKKSRRSR